MANSDAISSMFGTSRSLPFWHVRSTRLGTRAFNVGSGTPRTVGEMAAALARALNGPCPTVTGTYRLGDVRHITADSSRLRREFTWDPKVTFEEGMAELALVEPGVTNHFGNGLASA